MSLQLVPTGPTAMHTLIEMTLATCVSPATKRVYRLQLTKFIASGHPLNREGVAIYIQSLRDLNMSSATILGSLSAIKKLAQEAEVRGLMSWDLYSQIKSLSAGRHFQTRAGNWMTIEQVQEFLGLPDRSKYWGKRDACILSLMLGCGLRRAEMATLTWDRYQSRDGRMCLVDVLGKGRKLRTLPVPQWARPDVDAWHEASRKPAPAATNSIEKAREARRRIDRNLVTGGIGIEGIFTLVEYYGNRVGLDLSPHDLRRTLAQMLRKSGAHLEQIQYTLGHQNVSTTVLYLGSVLELAPGLAAVDTLKITSTRQREHCLSPESADILTMHLEAERAAVEALQQAPEEEED